MQFLVIAQDGQDALRRRLDLRERHLAVASRLRAAGNLLYGVATIDEEGQPNGSVEVAQFDSRAELDEWLRHEPFVIGQVWDKVKVTPCRVGPMFASQ